MNLTDMTPATRQFLALLQSAIGTDAIDECLHCTVAGNGPLAKTAGIDNQTISRANQEEVLDELKDIALDTALVAEVAQTYGYYLFWMFNHVYLVSPTPTPDFNYALQRMACRVEWGELWKISRCNEPPMKPLDEALAFLKGRMEIYPQWQDSALIGMITA